MATGCLLQLSRGDTTARWRQTLWSSAIGNAAGNGAQFSFRSGRGETSARREKCLGPEWTIFRESQGELVEVPHGCGKIIVNDVGKFINCMSFKKERWEYRRTYLDVVGDSMVVKSLQEKRMNNEVRKMIGNVRNLDRLWGTVDECCERPEKYIL
jgi:hypothetical protein